MKFNLPTYKQFKIAGIGIYIQGVRAGRGLVQTKISPQNESIFLYI